MLKLYKRLGECHKRKEEKHKWLEAQTPPLYAFLRHCHIYHLIKGIFLFIYCFTLLLHIFYSWSQTHLFTQLSILLQLPESLNGLFSVIGILRRMLGNKSPKTTRHRN